MTRHLGEACTFPADHDPEVGVTKDRPPDPAPPKASLRFAGLALGAAAVAVGRAALGPYRFSRPGVAALAALGLIPDEIEAMEASLAYERRMIGLRALTGLDAETMAAVVAAYASAHRMPTWQSMERLYERLAEGSLVIQGAEAVAAPIAPPRPIEEIAQAMQTALAAEARVSPLASAPRDDKPARDARGRQNKTRAFENRVQQRRKAKAGARPRHKGRRG